MYAELSNLLAGVGLGITGLAPFIHTNTVIAALQGVEFKAFDLFAVGLVFSRIPFEIVANAKMGLAGEYSALSLEKVVGKGKETAEFMLLHLVAAMAFSLIILFPLYSLVGKAVQTAVQPLTPVLLAGTALWFTLSQEDKASAFIVALLAGVTGVVVLQKNLENPLFILLTGVYAIPALLVHKKQTNTMKADIGFFPALIVVGSFIAMSSAFLPAMTPAALTVTALCFLQKKGDAEFIALNTSILGSRAVSDFAALEFVSKGRSGATAKMIETTYYNFSTVYLYIAIGVIIFIAAAFIALKTWQKIPTIFNSAKQKMALILLIFLYVYYVDSLIGVIALAVSSLVGLTCQEFEKSPAMLGACILVPSILNYF